MRVDRSLFVYAMLLGLAVLPTPSFAQTSDYPNKPVRLVSAYPPGGPNDIVARAVADSLADILKQQVIVDNRGGAGGTTGTNFVAKAAPDGYTLLTASGANAIAPFIYNDLPFDMNRDFISLGLVGAANFFLVVNSAVPVKSIDELVQLAKSKPGGLKYATPGNGTPAHIAGELLNARAGIKLTHVPYKGAAQAYLDLAAGFVDMTFAGGDGQTAVDDVKAGKLRPIASVGRKRSLHFPDSPIMSEVGFPDFEITTWYGVALPAGTPQPIVDKLAAAVKAVSSDKKFADRLAAMGLSVASSTPAEMADLIRNEGARLGPIVKAANIQPN